MSSGPPNPRPLHPTLSLEAWLFRAPDCKFLGACIATAGKKQWAGLNCYSCPLCPEGVKDPCTAWRKASTIPDSLTNYEQPIRPLIFCEDCEHWLPYPEFPTRGIDVCRGCRTVRGSQKRRDRKERLESSD